MTDNYLENVLKKLDEQKGFGGDFSFIIRMKGGQSYFHLITIHDLTRDAAHRLFDQFHEHHDIGMLKDFPEIFRISIDEKDKERDFIYLPNSFTS